MIRMDVELDERSTKFLIEQARTFPREVRRAFYYACGISLRIMRSRMSGRSDKIARWDDFTKRLRERCHWATAGTFGGHLMYPNGRQLTMQPEGDRVRIGWIGALEDYAARFQDGGSEDTTPDWRHSCYQKGFAKGEVPTVAVTPARPVVQQTNDESSKHVAEWTLGAFDKVMSRRIKAWQFRYYRSTHTQRGALAVKIGSGYSALRRGVVLGDKSTYR